MSENAEEEFSQQEDLEIDQAPSLSLSSSSKVKPRTKSLSSMYTQSLAERKIGILGFFVIISVFLAQVFFIALLLFSYFPRTKPFVAKVMSYIL